ncbi:hypothetical protein F443_02122 [Phytophthora nicotianae P1569]|uniref:Uncharacterized protein n=1 Tax=Phytophthora nicotianae P1569 TaxID=1317065 RepID=V9FUK0_PHYNI|nr:hypothetical protein F443_02122 [Phytophthora nicotianae P1569]
MRLHALKRTHGLVLVDFPACFFSTGQIVNTATPRADTSVLARRRQRRQVVQCLVQVVQCFVLVVVPRRRQVKFARRRQRRQVVQCLVQVAQCLALVVVPRRRQVEQYLAQMRPALIWKDK